MFLIFGTAKQQPWNNPPQIVQEAEPLKSLGVVAKQSENDQEMGFAPV